MILDVVMNVVSDEVVLGFFHIDGRKFLFSYDDETSLCFPTCGLVGKERKKVLSITSAGVRKEKKAQNSNDNHGS